MRIDQRKLSVLLNGWLVNFSSERLMRLLTALGRDVETNVRPTPKSRKRGHIRDMGARGRSLNSLALWGGC
jgi:helix-turn-helix protein